MDFSRLSGYTLPLVEAMSLLPPGGWSLTSAD